MSDNEITKKSPASVTGVHQRLDAVETAVSSMKKEWEDAIGAIAVLGDGVVDERDGPALKELAQSAARILAEIGVIAATAIYVCQQVSTAIGGG